MKYIKLHGKSYWQTDDERTLEAKVKNSMQIIEGIFNDDKFIIKPGVMGLIVVIDKERDCEILAACNMEERKIRHISQNILTKLSI